MSQPREKQQEATSESPPTNKKGVWKMIWRILLTTLVSAICFVILFTFVNSREVISALQNISIFVLIASFMLYMVSYWFRAWKFKILFDSHIPMRQLIALVCAHTMASSILPARTGELSYFYFRKKVNKDHTIANSIASLAVVRIFDLAALLCIFLAAIVLMVIFPTNISLPQPVTAILWMSGAGIVLIIILLSLCITHGKRAMQVLHTILCWLRLNNLKLVQWFESKGTEIITSLNSITRKQVLILLFSSLMIWGGNFVVGYLVVKDIGLLLPFSFLMIGFTATTLANALPIHGFASLGSLEGIWTLIFVAFGAPEKIAITSGIGFHLVVIAYLVILGVVGVAYLHWKKDDKDDKKIKTI